MWMHEWGSASNRYNLSGSGIDPVGSHSGIWLLDEWAGRQTSVEFWFEDMDESNSVITKKMCKCNL